MKALRVENDTPQLVDMPEPDGDGVRVRVLSASICGSDVHMLRLGWLNGMVPGHEFAGLTPDGQLVAVEPMLSCGRCASCMQGYDQHCDSVQHVGATVSGGMAEYVQLPERRAGADAQWPVRRHRLLGGAFSGRRAQRGPGPAASWRARAGDRRRQHRADDRGRPDRARRALRRQRPPRPPARGGERLGASVRVQDGYDVVIDAVGNSESLAEAVKRLRPMGRIGISGTFWDAVSLDMAACLKEAEIIPALGYVCGARPNRTFDAVAQTLARNPAIAEAVITHRFPLEAGAEAFAVAADRAAGALRSSSSRRRPPPARPAAFAGDRANQPRHTTASSPQPAAPATGPAGGSATAIVTRPVLASPAAFTPR